MWRIVPKRAVSEAIAWGANRGIPGALRRTMLLRFARIYGIDGSEAE
jgi:phosphatidylserine decarboxylase